jgi:predicted RNase H-like HicB family nuclease
MTERQRMTLTVELEPLDGGWYEARLDEFPEVFTAAPSADEARVAILDALAQYLAACLEEGRRPVVADASTLVGDRSQ